jgi:hypothetical protein
LKVTVAKPKKKKVKAASKETNINSSVKTMPMFFFCFLSNNQILCRTALFPRKNPQFIPARIN